MKHRAIFLCKYLFFWMLYYSAVRLLFMLYQHSLAEAGGAMVHGWHMDLSMAGYIMLLASLLLALMWPLGAHWHMRVFRWLTLALIAAQSVVVVVDLELYRHWGYRIDATPLLYLRSPKEAMASTPLGMAIALIALAAAMVWGFFVIYKHLCNSNLNQIQRGRWWVMSVLLLVAGCMVLPIRGGLGIAPMNPGKVYFSSRMYSNHAALNVMWNFIYACTMSGDLDRRLPDTVSPEEAEAGFAQLMHTQPSSTLPLLRTQRPNVVVLLLESFTAKAVGFCGGALGCTPCIDTLAHEGLAYTRLYAAGDRSDKGIVAVLTGFPAQPKNSVIKYPSKTARLPSISKTLAQHGYSTAFYYGGDPTFANIQGFLYQCHFDRIVAHEQFPKEQRNSKWGAHDEYVLAQLLAEMDTARSPFFKMLFTLTSHEPFELPRRYGPPRLNSSEEERFLRTVHYADSCIGWFMEQAKQRSWYDSTLFVLIADHGHPMPMNDDAHMARRFHIPMLWLGGALRPTPGINAKVGGQIDLAATLLAQLGLPHEEFIFSKDLNCPTSREFAFYTFNNGYGFVGPADTLMFDLTSQRAIGTPPSEASIHGAGCFFRTYQDYHHGL